MTVEQLSTLYTIVFLGMLIVVCGFFTGVFLLIHQRMFRWSWWAVSTGSFVFIVLVTIYIWRIVIPSITGYPL